MRALILDCEGARPTADERALFRDADPWGFILFARHCQSAEDVRALCADLRDCVGRDAPVFIDQEGGRVARMKAPAFPPHPPMDVFGALWRDDPEKAKAAARLNARLIGRLVSDLGVDIDCVPMLDVRQPDADKAVIGDRALAEDADIVAVLGREVMEGLMEGGALPVIKHMPGHGRATVDSHHHLPRVSASREALRAVDFAPFRALKDAPIGMTAHVVFEAFDPERCGTMSPAIVQDVIRGEIGFGGLLVSDDLKMRALGGPVGERVQRCLAAGVDIACCCNFSFEEKVEAASAAWALADEALARADAALALRPQSVLRADTAPDYERLAAMIATGLAA
ncbi:MAG: beta-N-acetylhexosaminidase [Parvularculaceae bacterium]|nr:beta-N-acetylhexosaminidase [Parvularculaceae bacterium]